MKPFLALRSYLPADHPDKSKEIGSEATPAEFIDVLLKVTQELRRVLAPHGSIAIELGDTYAGSGGAHDPLKGPPIPRVSGTAGGGGGPGWPLPKSKALIPEAYRFALAYGFNPLTGQPSPAGQWRVRNVVIWARPNPPVGALGDKWRPATSDLVVACTSDKRYWDDLATRRPADTANKRPSVLKRESIPGRTDQVMNPLGEDGQRIISNGGGAPLLDYWEIPPGGYNGQVSYEWKRPVDQRESAGDIRRTTSADCPEHGGQADPVPMESHDGQRSSDPSLHSRDTDVLPVQGQLLDSVPTGRTIEPETEGSSSDLPGPLHALTATRRGKGSSKTAPAPATNPSDTPSVETTPRTGGKSASPESGEHRRDTSESSISVGGSVDSPESRTAGGTADTDTEPASSEACTCSYYVLETKYTSHYAVFPSALVEPLVKAMCPQRVCRECGEPSRRIVENGAAYERDTDRRHQYQRTGVEAGRLTGTGASFDGAAYQTLGWTDCGHDDYRPGLVLDPFAGSGTTLAVATGHGHDAIGIDLDSRNADLAMERVGPMLFEMESVR